MEWSAEGILLSVRKHGENAAIIETLTAEHGRHAGLVRGGAGRRYTATLQPGNQLALTWRGRLEENLGSFSRVELVRSRMGDVVGDREALAVLDSARALLCVYLPDREVLTAMYHATDALFGVLSAPDARRLAYARWEVLLLSELGFALDLERCAVTGAGEGLAYVSPRSGRAVTAQAAGAYAEKLLKLPDFITRKGIAPTKAELHEAMLLTGYFLENWANPAHDQQRTPPARERLVALLSRAS